MTGPVFVQVQERPPYISQAKLAGERAGLLANEPREAFDGGPYGLSIHQRGCAKPCPSSSPKIPLTA